MSVSFSKSPPSPSPKPFGRLKYSCFSFFLLTRPRPQHHPPSKRFQSEVVKILRLNKQQATTFNALADEHRLQINAINERKAKLLLPYFERLADTSKRIDADSLLNQFQQAEKEKIEATYQHFQEIKKY